MKTKCPICKEQIDFDTSEYDEGDFFRCQECSELLTVEVKKGEYKLVTDQEKKYEEMQELDEEFDYEDDEA
ncbi:MAG TPA: hypothetical protein VJG83_04780 [archaeon]|nr:hypothetical protein [archaeon]